MTFGVAASVIAITAAAGCGRVVSRTGSPVTGTTVIKVGDAANGKAVSAEAGDRIELTLSSSYWNLSGSSKTSVLRPDGPPRLLSRPSNCPDIPGLGCVPMRADFTALTEGKAVILATRSSCGEALRCKPDERRFTVTIVVAGRN